MAQMNPGIILSGQMPNVIGALDAGAVAAQRVNDIRQQNALRQFLQEQGPAMFAGDTNALRGYAAFDPMAAFNMQSGFDERAWNAESRDMERQRFEMEQQRFAADMDPEEEDYITGTLTGAAYYHAMGDRQGYDTFLAQNGVDPAAVPFEAFPAIAAQAGIFDAGDVREMAAPAQADPQSAIAKLQQDLTNGLITQEQFDLAIQNMAPTGMTIESTPGGGLSVTQGPGVTGRPPTERQATINLFGTMMDVAAPVLNQIETQYDPANVPDAVATVLGVPGNFLRSQEGQEYAAAAKAWAEGALRLSTGAAATQPEIERIFTTYFAQPGDSAETVAFKRRLREAYAQAIVAASGNTFAPGQSELPPDPLGQPTDAQPQQGQASMPDFSQMSRDDLLAADLSTLDRAGLEAWNRALDALEGQ